MPNLKRRYVVNFNVLMTEEIDKMLIDLADTASLSKAQVVRACIKGRYAMVFQRQPLCADGGSCRCPHAHIYPPADVPPPPDPDRPL